MYATIATIKIAHLVVRGVDMAPNKTFKSAGEEIIAELGTKAAGKLFEQCAEALHANPDARYADIAGAVRDLRQVGAVNR